MALKVFSIQKPNKEIERLKKESYKLSQKQERLRLEIESIKEMKEKINKRIKELESK